MIEGNWLLKEVVLQGTDSLNKLVYIIIQLHHPVLFVVICYPTNIIKSFLFTYLNSNVSFMSQPN